MSLVNKWVSYADRTYAQLKDRFRTFLSAEVPEITDHTSSNPLVKIGEFWSAIGENLNYYIDFHARESQLISARLYKSIVKHAKAYDYRIKGATPATVSLRFTINTQYGLDITIPEGTIVQLEDGSVSFRTLADAIITAGDLFVDVEAEQSTEVTDSNYTTINGTDSFMEIALPANVADNSVTVTVGGDAFTPKESLYESLSTDKHFVYSVNEDKLPIIRFGDGINGEKPDDGDDVDLTYKTTQGASGNVPIGTLISMPSPPSMPGGITLSVNNNERASGGSDIETLAELKKNIPISLRTQERAVTVKDYEDLVKTYPGVSNAKAIFDCGNKDNIYIVPNGGGIATSTLRTNVGTYLDDKKIMGKNVTVFSAGIVKLLFDIDINVLPTHVKNIVIAAVKAEIVDFASYENQEIKGKVELSDIYEIIEGVPGVDYSNINKMTPTPYARPADDNMPELDWDREILAASTKTIQWEIRMASGSTYQLFKNNVFLGTKNVGDQINLAEIVFTVNAGSYSTNDQWFFYTYPYYGTVNLQEPSLAITETADINITATGGL